LPTRNDYLDSLKSKDTFLLFFDCLGVEYLSFISELANKYDLSISIRIARANLPTVTSLNNDFYIQWPFDCNKNSKLDDLKHNKDNQYISIPYQSATYLVKELDIIAEVISEADLFLKEHRFKKYLIVSDHGASRLAVLNKNVKKYKTMTKGIYSGRCCEKFEPCDLPFAADENGYLVLADYGSFQGSRAAEIEVHGGATLEEVVIPIIELTLKDKSISIELERDIIKFDTKNDLIIYLISNYPLLDINIYINKIKYLPVNTENCRYSFNISQIKKSGTYCIDVVSNNIKIKTLTLTLQSQIAEVNPFFDDLF
jgi:hypothetical protein